MRSRSLLFLELSRPLFILAVLAQGFLGLGIARYLGASLDAAVVFLALGVTLFLALTGVFLFAHFHHPDGFAEHDAVSVLLAGRYQFFSETGSVDPALLPPQTAFLAAAVSLTLSILCGFVLVQANAVTPVAGLFALLLLLGALLYSLPGSGLANSGFGELLLAVELGVVVPTFVFTLVAGDFHRLLALVGLPLVFLLLATQLLLEFPSYRVDVSAGPRNLLARLGWERGLFFHNVFLLLSFLSIAAISLVGVSMDLLLMPLLVLPVAALQVWNMRRLAAGAAPQWGSKRLLALVIYGAVAYLLIYSFWVR